MHNKSVDFFIKNNIEFYPDASMARYSSVGIGAEAAFILFPRNEDELILILDFLRENSFRHRLVGRMTNLLPKDDYYDGAIVSTRKMTKMLFNGEYVTAECGVSLPTLIHAAASHSLGGAESLSGIPGTVGGALYSNAGAFGEEISNFIDSVRIYDTQSCTVTALKKSELFFSYRDSFLKSGRLVLLSAKLRFFMGARENIKSKIGEVKNRRIMTQPLDYPSLGSVFKRRGDVSAAKLIDACGLKGLTVGGASVSSKHAGFIINIGGATERDYIELISIVKQEVFNKFSIVLEEEIEYL